VKIKPKKGGEEVEVNVTWTPTKGTFGVKAAVDPENKMAEMSEDNNTIGLTITVKEKGGNGGGGDGGGGGKKKTPGFETVLVSVAIISALVIIGMKRRRR
jgi:hypothetical protein